MSYEYFGLGLDKVLVGGGVVKMGVKKFSVGGREVSLDWFRICPDVGGFLGGMRQGGGKKKERGARASLSLFWQVPSLPVYLNKQQGYTIV